MNKLPKQEEASDSQPSTPENTIEIYNQGKNFDEEIKSNELPPQFRNFTQRFPLILEEEQDGEDNESSLLSSQDSFEEPWQSPQHPIANKQLLNTSSKLSVVLIDYDQDKLFIYTDDYFSVNRYVIRTQLPVAHRLIDISEETWQATLAHLKNKKKILVHQNILTIPPPYSRKDVIGEINSFLTQQK